MSDKDKKKKVIDEDTEVVDKNTELVEDELDAVAGGLNPQPEPPARQRFDTTGPDLQVGRSRRRFRP